MLLAPVALLVKSVYTLDEREGMQKPLLWDDHSTFLRWQIGTPTISRSAFS